MTQVGKIFNKIPYLVRDKENKYKDIKYLEDLILHLEKKNIKAEDIIHIFSNNRDNILHFHLVIKSSLPKDNLLLNYNKENIEFTFEQYNESKTKTNYINSFMFIETFKHLNEHDLVSAFDEMIGCNGKKLFISVSKDKLKQFDPKNKHYLLRKILLEKKEIIEDTANSFNIECSELFEDLTPNIIKGICKDLNLTYKILASNIGYKPDTINKAASTGKISEQLNKAIELYLENLRLKEELNSFKLIKQSLQNITI